VCAWSSGGELNKEKSAMKRIPDFAGEVPHNCLNCKHKSYSLFGCCDTVQSEQLGEEKHMRRLRKGEILYREGEPVNHVYCIHEGLIKLVKNPDTESEHIISIQKAAEMPGYKSFLAQDLHSETAIALQDAIVCELPGKQIEQMLKEIPAFSRESMMYLAGLADNYEQQISSLMLKPVKVRVAEALLLLHRAYMDLETNPKGIIMLSRKELASYCGTVKETLLRTLKVFKEEGLVETEGTAIEITNLSGLVRVCGEE
jgi:CRP-like cAMP-binding protein